MTLLTRTRADERQFEVVYEQYFGLLVDVATFKFRVPETDAESLAHDVLMTYLRKASTVIDLRSWIIGAICYASRHYWRLNDRHISVATEFELERADPASLRILESLPDQLAAREALECLSPRYREILQMRYFEGCTVPEIAARLGVKAKYAQKLISKCLRRAEQLYNRKEQEKGRAT